MDSSFDATTRYTFSLHSVALQLYSSRYQNFHEYHQTEVPRLNKYMFLFWGYPNLPSFLLILFSLCDEFNSTT